MATNAERQRAHRERMKAAGLTRATVWCGPEAAKTLAKLKPEALDALLPGNAVGPLPGNTLEAVKAVATDWRGKVDDATRKALEKGQRSPAESSRWANAVALLEAMERALDGEETTP